MSGWTLIGNTANRNTYYWVTMNGYNYRYDGANYLNASWQFLLYESQSNPYNTGYGNMTVSNPTSNNDIYPNCFQLGNGSNTQWSVNSNHPNWQALPNGGIRIWAIYRNATYWVTITATTYRFDGQTPKSTTVQFNVTEPNWPAPTANATSWQSLGTLSYGQSIVPTDVSWWIDGHGASLNWQISYNPYGISASMSGSTLYINENIAFGQGAIPGNVFVQLNVTASSQGGSATVTCYIYAVPV